VIELMSDGAWRTALQVLRDPATKGPWKRPSIRRKVLDLYERGILRRRQETMTLSVLRPTPDRKRCTFEYMDVPVWHYQMIIDE